MANESNADHRLDAALRAFHHRQSTAAAANEDCPSAETLLDYLDRRLAEEQVASIHDHLPYCAACRDLVLSFRDEAAAEDLPTPAAAERAPRPTLRRWIPAAAFASGLLLVALVALNLYPSKRSLLSYVDGADFGFAARSGGNKLDPMAAAYQRGVAALIDSQTWIFRRTDERKVDEAIRSLEQAKALAVASGNQTYQGDCAYYLGKAYLKKNDLIQARREFEEVSKLDNPSQALLMRKRLAEEALRHWPSIE